MFTFTLSAQTDAAPSSDKEKTEKAECSKKDGKMNGTVTMYCDYECPSDDYCNGCLYSTYKTEYCVGQRCRNRTLYKCNVCGDTWWIYHK